MILYRAAIGLAACVLLMPSMSFADEIASRPAVSGAAAAASEQAAAESPMGISPGPDFNRTIFYRNKLELSLETGGLFFNTPHVLDWMAGESYNRPKGSPNYLLIPAFASIRWHLYSPTGDSILRGNTDLTAGAFYTAIVRGPESVFTGAALGLRYNFVQPDARLVPYVEARGGVGFADAKGPQQVKQKRLQTGLGEDLNFGCWLGTGVRYQIDARYSVSLGAELMHISNAGLSEPRYVNHAINVVGPFVGLNISLDDLFPSTN